MAGPDVDPQDLSDFVHEGWARDDNGNWKRTPVRGVGFEVRDYGAFGRAVYVAVYHVNGRPVPITTLFSSLEAAKEELWRRWQAMP